jgi:hypothetical protein
MPSAIIFNWECSVWGIALMMEVASTTETSVNFYPTTCSYNPEDSHLQTRRRENLKSYLQFYVYFREFGANYRPHQLYIM